ncbi:MAG: very short patch repair endonuclease [Bryobacteraceae bacterium]
MREPADLRSRIMRAVKGRDTAPELTVRRIAHGLGYRFRLHRPDIPGKPDLAFPRLRKVIFVHGCFWHGHRCKRGARVPKSNREYWIGKVARNRARDIEVRARLRTLGWKRLIVWECQLRDVDRVRGRISRFLEA